MKKSAIFFFFLIPFIAFTQQNSVLSSGDWYKIAVDETGVYKITYDDLASYGIDVDNTDPRYIGLFGNPAGMLPELLEDPFYTDLQPVAIRVIGEEDGVFNHSDYILFYGQDPVIWEYDPVNNQYHHVLNLYTEKTHYFITILNESGKRIQQQASEVLPQNADISVFDYLIYHENELTNPGKTGKIWLGELFHEDLNIDFNYLVTPLHSTGHQFATRIMARSSETSYFDISIDNVEFEPISINPINYEDPYQLYRQSQFNTSFSMLENSFTVSYNFDPGDEFAKGWLDYFELILKVYPDFTNDQMSFRSTQNIGAGNISRYSLQYLNPEDLEIWNVTDPINVTKMELNIDKGYVRFKVKDDSLLEFQAFKGNAFNTPEFIGLMENQNLHAYEPPDLLIITHPDFSDQASQLSTFHVQKDEMSVGVFTTQQVYNEFSTGAQDVTAIRNFVRHLKEQSGDDNKPDYLLLFGDASYDYMDRIENNTNFVPTYETWESSNVVNSFATDDYFGLQDMDEPYGNGEPQVAVGRIPVKTVGEADAVFNKIQTYYSNDALGAWKNEFMFIGDDGDNNLHMHHTEVLSDTVSYTAPVLNNTKCYLDFYELVETEEGPRYPEVVEIIDNKMDNGVFYVNYTGHGWPMQLANENVVNSEIIAGWTNDNYLPIWLTASGGVVHYDDPEIISLAEQMMLMDNGGSIGFIGNSRAGFASTNLVLNLAVLEKLLDPESQYDMRLGDLIKYSGSQFNSEKWTLLGDPALKISFPEFNVSTTTLNGVDIEEYMDTIAPGDFLTFEGLITSKDDGSTQIGFDGTVYLKVYAPSFIRSTHGNQGNTIMDVTVQDSVLIEGTALVENGAFEIQIYLPANSYEDYGNLKLSWYAENGETDASGYYAGPVFGGEPSGVDDFNRIADLVKVYPSPFTDFVTVQIPDISYGTVDFSVYNLMGAKVYSGQINDEVKSTRINLQYLSKGLYMLQLGNSKFQKSFKILKN